MSERKFRSLIEEINENVPEKYTYKIVENRGDNIISSASNLLELVEKHYGVEEAQELEKKLILSIKNRNSKKFKNKLRLIEEKHNED